MPPILRNEQRDFCAKSGHRFVDENGNRLPNVFRERSDGVKQCAACYQEYQGKRNQQKRNENARNAEKQRKREDIEIFHDTVPFIAADANVDPAMAASQRKRILAQLSNPPKDVRKAFTVFNGGRKPTYTLVPLRNEAQAEADEAQRLADYEKFLDEVPEGQQQTWRELMGIASVAA
jgi:hypothetical protein